MTAWLKGDNTKTSTVYVSEILIDYPNVNDAKSFALRLIIHYVGDLHQPLHATSEVNSQFPEGDRGGNSHKVPSKDGASNLHAVWDSVIYSYSGFPNLPLSTSDWSWYSNEAANLASKYPVDMTKVHASDFDYWAKEGLQVSKDYVYNGFVDGQIPSSAYQTRAANKLKSQMMLGARRLAQEVIAMYNAR